MSTAIHPTAVIEEGAVLGADVQVGPYCVVGPHAVLGDGVVLHSHVVVAGHTEIGEGTRVFPFASIGHAPQDLKYKGEPSRLVIGRHNTIREHVTINPGTEGGGLLTQIGDHCLLMVGAHVAHDCRIGNHVVLVNNATLGGHVTVGDYAIIGGLSAIHQFVRIGEHAMIGGMSGIESDVIPFGSAMGERARLAGLNIVGMKRRGFDKDQMHSLRSAVDALFAEQGTFAERLEQVEADYAHDPVVMAVVAFIRSDNSRSLCQPKPRHG